MSPVHRQQCCDKMWRHTTTYLFLFNERLTPLCFQRLIFLYRSQNSMLEKNKPKVTQKVLDELKSYVYFWALFVLVYSTIVTETTDETELFHIIGGELDIANCVWNVLNSPIYNTSVRGGGPKIPRIFKKIYCKHSYKSDTSVPFTLVPLWPDAAVLEPLSLLETLSKIFHGKAFKCRQWFSGNICVPPRIVVLVDVECIFVLGIVYVLQQCTTLTAFTYTGSSLQRQNGYVFSGAILIY
jgi:hypothetical protein